MNHWCKCLHCKKIFLSGGCVQYRCGAIYCDKCDVKLILKKKNLDFSY